jgi:hypothetical protein
MSGVELPGYRSKADGSCCDGLEVGRDGGFLQPSSLQTLSRATFGGPTPKEVMMNSVWKSLTFIVGESSLAWTVLFVVGFACILAFAFQATIDIIVAIIALGCITAVAEHVMHSRNHP